MSKEVLELIFKEYSPYWDLALGINRRSFNSKIHEFESPFHSLAVRIQTIRHSEMFFFVYKMRKIIPI